MKKLLEKFLSIHMKTPVLETLFNHVAAIRSTILLKRDSNTFFYEYCKIFKNAYFEENL